MLPWVCSVIDYRGRQNVVKTSVTHAHLPAARVPLLLFYHILTSSVIYYWTDAQQHGIYLLNMYTSLWVYHNTGGHFQWNLPDRCMWSFQRYLPNKLHLDGNHDYRRCIYQRLNKPGEKEKSKVNDHMTRRTMANSSAWPSFLRNHHSRAFDNGQRLIKQNSNITLVALQTKLQIIYYSLVSHSQKSLEHTENQTKYRKMTRKPQSPGRIFIYRTCRAFRKIQKNSSTVVIALC